MEREVSAAGRLGVASEEDPGYGRADISLRGCAAGNRGMVAVALVGAFVAAVLMIVTGDSRWGQAVVFIPLGVLALAPILWLRWLTPAPNQRRRYFAALSLGCLWGVAVLVVFFAGAALLIS